MVVYLVLYEKDRECQEAYKYLMTTKVNFKPFIVRGANVRDQLRKMGITKVPTLVLTNKKIFFEGMAKIKKVIESNIFKSIEHREESRQKDSYENDTYQNDPYENDPYEKPMDKKQVEKYMEKVEKKVEKPQPKEESSEEHVSIDIEETEESDEDFESSEEELDI